MKLLCTYVVRNKISQSKLWHVIIDGFCNVSYEKPLILQCTFQILNFTSLYNLYVSLMAKNFFF